MPDYISAKDAAAKWGLSRRQVVTHCINGRIPGAFKLGSGWAVPVNAEKPVDRRIKSGKYIMYKGEPQDGGGENAGGATEK